MDRSGRRRSRDLDQRIREVLDLDRAGREEIIAALLASFDQDDGIDRAWLEEAHRRFAVIRGMTDPTS